MWVWMRHESIPWTKCTILYCYQMLFLEQCLDFLADSLDFSSGSVWHFLSSRRSWVLVSGANRARSVQAEDKTEWWGSSRLQLRHRRNYDSVAVEYYSRAETLCPQGKQNGKSCFFVHPGRLTVTYITIWRPPLSCPGWELCVLLFPWPGMLPPPRQPFLILYISALPQGKLLLVGPCFLHLGMHRTQVTDHLYCP